MKGKCSDPGCVKTLFAQPRPTADIHLAFCGHSLRQRRGVIFFSLTRRTAYFMFGWQTATRTIRTLALPNDILTPRLVLRLMGREVIDSCLAGDLQRAERLSDTGIPSELLDELTALTYARTKLDADPQYRPWSIRAIILPTTRTMVGHIRFHSCPDPAYLHAFARPAVEFGYHMFSEYRLRGYATEAAHAVMDWAWATCTRQRGVARGHCTFRFCQDRTTRGRDRRHCAHLSVPKGNLESARAWVPLRSRGRHTVIDPNGPHQGACAWRVSRRLDEVHERRAVLVYEALASYEHGELGRSDFL